MLPELAGAASLFLQCFIFFVPQQLILFYSLMKKILIIPILIILWFNAFSQSKLILKSGFEKNTEIEVFKNGHFFTGEDKSSGFSWDDNQLNGRLNFFYLAGDQPEKYVETRIDNVRGHDNKKTRAVYMAVKNDLHGDGFGMVTRNELSYFPDSPLKEGYVSLWMKLQDDLLDKLPKTKRSHQLDYYQLDSWRMLMEIKEPNSGVSKKGRGTNNYRMSFFMTRDSLTNKMYWLLRGEMPQPVRLIDWEIENKSVEVPIGEWFKMEVYFRKDRTNGRIWWAINNQEIADYRGRTEHPDNPMPVKFWSFAKLYQDEKWFEPGPVYQWIDDLEYWTGFPLGHPHEK